jgi:hypothetical protein
MAKAASATGAFDDQAEWAVEVVAQPMVGHDAG